MLRAKGHASLLIDKAKTVSTHKNHFLLTSGLELGNTQPSPLAPVLVSPYTRVSLSMEIIPLNWKSSVQRPTWKRREVGASLILQEKLNSLSQQSWFYDKKMPHLTTALRDINSSKQPMQFCWTNFTSCMGYQHKIGKSDFHQFPQYTDQFWTATTM